MSPQPSSTSGPATSAAPSSRALREPVGSWRSNAALLGIVAVLAAASAYLLVERPWISKHLAAPANAAPFAPPPHSVAVLPFVNMSGDKDQEYFSDGLTEELLNSLSRIDELQVAARTSAFSFKGKDTDIGTIGRKLNVAAVLEGSVRRSAHTVRITTQLINAVTGYHLWSETYDRDLGDILKLQSEIATAVASALKITLLGNEAAKIEVGGTRNPAAFDAYLRAAKILSSADEAQDFQSAIALNAEAIRLDPDYALAYASRSIAISICLEQFEPEACSSSAAQAQADADKAIALAPELAEGHLALAARLSDALDFGRANQEYQRAAALAPNNPQVLRSYCRFVTWMGQAEAGIAAARRTVVLDPLSAVSHYRLGQALFYARRYEAAVAAYSDALALDPQNALASSFRGMAYYLLGNAADALSSCALRPEFWAARWCLAVTYYKLGRRADATTALDNYITSEGDSDTYEFAAIYAQWGDIPKALASLEKSMRLRNRGLIYVKTDPLVDALRKEPRFQAIERALKFPPQ
jgi:TolB-like protein/Flp pilus assembly protein TadD